MFYLSSADFFQSKKEGKSFFPKDSFRNTIIVSNGLDPDQDWHSGSKLLAKVISRQQKSPQARKDLLPRALKHLNYAFHVHLFILIGATRFGWRIQRKPHWNTDKILSSFCQCSQICHRLKQVFIPYHITSGSFYICVERPWSHPEASCFRARNYNASLKLRKYWLKSK